MQTLKQKIGQTGENVACQYLVENGYTILERNYRSGHDEIDIIAENASYIAFVEVKTRSERNNPRYGRPAAAVNAKKRYCLARAAEAYIRSHKSEKFHRLDIVEIIIASDRQTGEGYYRINHMKGAFGAGGRIGF